METRYLVEFIIFIVTLYLCHFLDDLLKIKGKPSLQFLLRAVLIILEIIIFGRRV